MLLPIVSFFLLFFNFILTTLLLPSLSRSSVASAALLLKQPEETTTFKEEEAENKVWSNSSDSSMLILQKRDERYTAMVTTDFPHLLGFNRLEAWMDQSENPCNDFYKYACGGFQKRYSEFKDTDIMKIMGKSNSILMKSILSQSQSALAKTPLEQDLFSKAKAYHSSCEDKKLIRERGFKPIIPIANFILEKVRDPSLSLPALFGHLQTQGVNVLFRTKFTKIESQDPDDLRLQFFPATAFEVPHHTIRKVMTIFLNNNIITHHKGLDLNYLSKWVAKVEQANVKFMHTMNKLRRKSAFDKADQFQSLEELNSMTGMDWKDMLSVLKLTKATKVHLWSGLKPWIKIFRKYDHFDRVKLEYFLLWRLAASHFNKLSHEYADFWQADIYGVALKTDYPEIDMDMDIFQRNCVEETGRNLRYLAGHIFIQYAFNATQKHNAEEMIDNLFEAFRDRIIELDWMDEETKTESLEKLDSIVRVVGHPDWLADPQKVADAYKPLSLSKGKYFENALQAQVFTALVPHIRQSEHASLDRANIYFGFPWQLNAFHLTDLVLIQINSGVLQRPIFSELNPIAMNYGGIGSIISHEITHGFDSIGSLLDSRGVRRHWMTEKSHHEFFKRSKCFVKQYNELKVKLSDGSIIRPNGKKSLPENMADNGGMHTAFRAMAQAIGGENVDPYTRLHPNDPFSPAQTFFLAMGQSWCGQTTPNMVRYMVSNDVHSPNSARVQGSIANSEEFAKAFRCKMKPPNQMCRAY